MLLHKIPKPRAWGVISCDAFSCQDLLAHVFTDVPQAAQVGVNLGNSPASKLSMTGPIVLPGTFTERVRGGFTCVLVDNHESGDLAGAIMA